MLTNPRDIAERARRMAERREKDAERPAQTWPAPALKSTAAHYRTLAESLEHQTRHIHALREQLSAADMTRRMVRELAGEAKTPA